ncbi:hypothetical protein [Gemmiger formicilis]|uniref:hypothetical protein n=1 Tax=Gemmiger formicilis TaxID=745368 RepID=UPI003994F549
MLYDESRMTLTKERLEDLRKEKKLSFEQLSKQLAERGVSISHTNLKNYEINDPLHPPVWPYPEHEHRISGGFCRFL